MPVDQTDYDVLECFIRQSAHGPVLLVRVHRKDMAPMGYRELWDLFDELYPGRWGQQMFPPRRLLLDQANKYHLWVYEEGVHPKEFDLMED